MVMKTTLKNVVCPLLSIVRYFLPGHDQKLRTELENRVGGLAALRSIVEAAEGLASGELSPSEHAHRIRAVLNAARP